MAQLNGIIRGNINDVATKETINENTAYNFQDIQGIGLTNEQMTNALTTAQNGFFKKDSVWYCTDSGTYTKDHFYQFTITGTSPVDNVASWTDLGALGGSGGTELIVTQNADIASSDWDAVTGVDGYSYSADIEVEGAEASDISIVTFNNEDADSGNFASVCDTYEGVVTIYAKQAQDVTIPNILTIKTGVEPVPPGPGPAPSVLPFQFNGNTLTKYTGDDTEVIIPSSYSLGEIVTEHKTWSAEQPYEAFEKLRQELGDYFFYEESNYPITITADGTLYTFNSVDDYYEHGTALYEALTLEMDLQIQQYIEGNDYNVTAIGDHVFSDYTSLTSVIIGSGVTSIGGEAFRNCSGLTDITIPNTVTSIVVGAFTGCTSLTNVTYSRSGEGYTFKDGVLTLTSAMTSASTTPAWYNAHINQLVLSVDFGSLTHTCIQQYAFYNCYNLTSVTIPNSVTSIGRAAFSNSGLTTVTIPSSVTSIGDNVFYSCRDLTTVTIPSSVTSIGSYAFYECGDLTSITIPSSVTSIGSNAFQSCNSLTNLIVSANYNNTTNSNRLNSGQNYGVGQNPSIISTSGYVNVIWNKVS